MDLHNLFIDLSHIKFDDSKQYEVQLMKIGKFKHGFWGRFEATIDKFKNAINVFKSGILGSEIQFNYFHERREAAGWIKELIIKAEDELWALVEFTENAIDKIKKRELKYVSAEFTDDYEDEKGKNHGFAVVGGALTNTPFLKNMAPVTLDAGEYKILITEGEVKMLEEIKKLLGIEDDSKLIDAVKKLHESSNVDQLKSVRELLKVEKNDNIESTIKQLQEKKPEIKTDDKAIKTLQDQLETQSKTIETLTKNLDDATDFIQNSKNQDRRNEVKKMFSDGYINAAQLEEAETDGWYNMPEKQYETMVKFIKAGGQKEQYLRELQANNSNNGDGKFKSAMEEITEKAKKLMEEGKAKSIADAQAMILNSDQALYKRYQEESYQK